MNNRVCLRLLMHFSMKHSVLYNMTRVRYAIEQLMCLVQLYYKYESARKRRGISQQQDENNKIIAGQKAR
jgi:hypothetical protein